MYYRTMAFLTCTLLAVFAVTGHASEHSTGYARIASYEDSSSLTGQLTIDVWYHFQDSARFGDTTHFYTQDSTWLITAESGSKGKKASNHPTFSPGDSVKKTYYLNYDTADLLFYPQEIKIQEQVIPLDSAGIDSFGIEMVSAGGHIFFTSACSGLGGTDVIAYLSM